jgi:hypothetical protein
VVLSAERFELMTKRQISLKDLLRSAPWHELEIERDKGSRARSTCEIPA